MRATILGLARDDIADPSVESHLENATYPAIDATAYERLDGTTIYAGDAAASIDTEHETIYVSEDAIATETEQAPEDVYCEWIADLDAGWLGVNRSDGDWLFDTLGAAKGTLIERAKIDVDGFAEADLGGIGEQMGWMRRAIDKDLRQPDGGSSEQQTGLSRFAGRTRATVTDGGRRD